MTNLPPALRELAGRLRGAVADWRLALLVALAAAAVIAAFQLPLAFSFQVGRDGGPATDRPFLAGFLPAEARDEPTPLRWRWSLPRAEIAVPGAGRQPLLVGLSVVAHRQDAAPDGPPTRLALDIGAAEPLSLTLRPGRARYLLYVPAAALDDGALRLSLAAEPWRPAGDPRGDLGVAVGGPLSVRGLGAAGAIWPGGGPMLAYPLAAGLLWLAGRVAGLGPRASLWLVVGLIAAALLLSVEARPRLDRKSVV